MRAKRRNNEIDRGVRGWIVNTAKRNLWRVSTTHELEDLIQEGYVWYTVCKNRYADKEPAHFMALFKTTFINEIHTLATKATRSRHVQPLAGFDQSKFSDVDQALEALTDPQPEEQTLTVLISSLPSEIKELLLTLLNDAREIPMLAKETEIQYLWRLIEGNAGLLSSKFFYSNNRALRLEDAFRAHFGTA